MTIMTKGWARSLHNPVHDNKNKEPCGWSNELGIIIHRFDLNNTICKCGSTQYQKQKYKGGWKRQKYDDSE